jgi:predicted glycosyltransferase involved in capsule biosynthesis
MLLSILIPGKNDNFRYNGSKTLELNVNQTIDNINHIGAEDVEIVLCDWGSEQKIVDHVITKKHKNFKCVYVSPEIAKKYNRKANYSIVHPINTAFRNSVGKYVLFWDSDCFVKYDTFVALYEFVKKMDSENDMKFYWGSRFNVPFEMYTNLSNNQDLSNMLADEINLAHDKIAGGDQFMGASISMLMNREIWENSSGWWEELTYWGWQDIEFHRRLLKRYEYGGDLEDVGKIKFYHLCQPSSVDGSKNNHFVNQHWVYPHWFYANNENWGLKNEKLEIIN